MKNENIRALTFAVALVSIIGSGVSLVHTRADSSIVGYSEWIDLQNPASTQPPESALAVQVRKSDIAFSIPHCDTSAYQSKFFLHVYPGSKGEQAKDFINRDFYLAGEPVTQAGPACVARRSFDINDAKKIVVGQFTTPEGKCCTVLWSRTFVINP